MVKSSTLSNEWRTSRYTLLTFLPKNLIEQFSRLANFYFLILALLQIFLPFSPVGPATSLLPLIFVVLASSVKVAYEDYLRHQVDKEVNNRTCQLYRNKRLVATRSKDIKVGDIVYVRNNEEIPCDLVLLAVCNNDERCYVTTANLDGETNLKSRTCYKIRERFGGIDEVTDSIFTIECESPNPTLYEFNGHLKAPADEKAYEKFVAEKNKDHNDELTRVSYVGSNQPTTILKRFKQITKIHKLNPFRDKKKPLQPEYLEISLDISNILLRGSRLRNTGHIYGIAIYTGRDTKLARNSQVKSTKLSSTENSIILFLILTFGLLMTLTLIATLMYSHRDFWYLQNLRESDSFMEIFIAHFLLYNYLVPISLYVTLEFIKFFGTISIVKDRKMKALVWNTIDINSKDDTSPPDNNRLSRTRTLESAKCHSSDLNEELGQIEVLFTDKTGTLTENKMRFMACTIYGRLHRAISGHLYLQPPELFNGPIPKVAHKLVTIRSNRHAAIATQHGNEGNPSAQSRSRQTWSEDSAIDQSFDHRVTPPINRLKLVRDLTKQQELVDFFICLCLCSTITMNESMSLADCLPEKTLNDYDYQSASPDEESLISAANQYGVILCKSSDQESFIAIRTSTKTKSLSRSKNLKASHKFQPIPEKVEVYTEKYVVRHFKRLMVLEFNSVRKRMSVIYEDCDNECYLMVSKGSEELLDCIKMSDLDSESEHQIDTILAHCDAFAKSGLRTLLVARKVLNNEELDRIQREMNEARQSIQHREHMMDRVHKRAEVDMQLVGGTAVEDMLQDGVPKTIACLREAGIKVWLLTGDKVETAIAVAHQCKLLEPGTVLFHLVRQQDAQGCQKLLMDFNEQIRETYQSQSAHKTHSDLFKSKNKPSFALITDGRSLYYATKYAKQDLAELHKHCACVLGCRLSPLQKAEVVKMIKGDEGRPITAAVGDGANDVSMIQEAHVGIGIVGKEGRQAVNCSDYAINRFHMLNRLIFVHGQLFYHRTANTVHYFFYKNLLFILPQFLYSFHNLSSGQSLYHPILLMCFNLLFTSLPVLLYGLLEVHIPETILESHPKLYRLNTRNKLMRVSVFASWQVSASLQALIAFFFIKFVWGSHTPFLESGKMSGINGFSIILYSVIVLIATVKLYFISKSHSFYFNVSAILSCLLLPSFLYAYSLFNR